VSVAKLCVCWLMSPLCLWLSWLPISFEHTLTFYIVLYCMITNVMHRNCKQNFQVMRKCSYIISECVQKDVLLSMMQKCQTRQVATGLSCSVCELANENC